MTNIPDLTVVEKKLVILIDVAIPYYQIKEKPLEKITKYKYLEIEIWQLWGKKTTTSINSLLSSQLPKLFRNIWPIQALIR